MAIKPIVIFFTLALILVAPACAQAPAIEYFHMPGCAECALTDQVVEKLGRTTNATIEWIDVGGIDGLRRWSGYGFTEVPAIVINNVTKFSGAGFTEENILAAVNVLVSENKTIPDVSIVDRTVTVENLSIAYIMGLFSGFSPCLLAILGFIFAYSVGKSHGLKDGMMRSIIFGIGLIAAYIILGIILLLSGKTMIGNHYVSLVAGLISVLIGLNLLDIVRLPGHVDDYYRRSASKYVGTWPGLLLLGMLFSMVKVPCAAPFLFVLINDMLTLSLANGLVILLCFCAGILTPFIVIGFIGGYALTAKIRTYKRHIKIMSGAVIICAGIWIMV